MSSKHLFKSALTSDSSTKQMQLGTLRKEYDTTNGFRTFKYVQASLLASTTNGICLSWFDTGGTVATDDISASSVNLPAGVAIGTLTHGNYGWIQVGGYHSAVDTNGDGYIADGDFIHLESTTDGKCAETAASAASTARILGVAVAAESSSTVAALLNCTYGDIIQ